MKRLLHFKYFFYASILLAAIFLYANGYFQPVEIASWPWLVASFLALIGGFGVLAWVWLRLLLRGGLAATYADAFISTNLTAMAKYVPGKVMLLHGVTAWLHDRRGLSRKQSGAVFVMYNLLYVAAGVLIGALLLPGLDDQMQLWYALALGVVALGFVLLNPLLHLGGRLLDRIRGTSSGSELTRVNVGLSAVLGIMLVWGLWGGGMALLIAALHGSFPPWSVMFAYPLSVGLGTLAIFAPGGIGVRESVLGFWLVQLGYEPAFAATVSAVSRLWFLSGEVTGLLIAMGWDRRLKKQRVNHSAGVDQSAEAS